MNYANTDIGLARELDTQDELAAFRDEFVIDDPNLIYLDGNSLGRLPKRTINFMRNTIEQEWGKRLIRVWNDGWINIPTELGAKIAKLVGAQADEILVTEATSINLYKLAVAALNARPSRSGVVSDVLNFPSDLYILQGIIDLMGKNYHLKLIPSADGISIANESVDAAIDSHTALASLTHVAFKSCFMYNMVRVTEQVHQAGALMLWDLSHSVGAVPVDLNGCNVDLAVGCTYKYLNGGPGSPAFLYVRRDLQTQLSQPMWGWFAAEDPFAFELDFTPATNISRYRVGTSPMLSYLADHWLIPLGFTLGTPRQAEMRGSHVSLCHPESYRISRALIEATPPAIQVIPDFRPPDNIRLGITPLYTTFTEIHQALDRMRTIVEEGIYEQYSSERLSVT